MKFLQNVVEKYYRVYTDRKGRNTEIREIPHKAKTKHLSLWKRFEQDLLCDCQKCRASNFSYSNNFVQFLL